MTNLHLTSNLCNVHLADQVSYDCSIQFSIVLWGVALLDWKMCVAYAYQYKESKTSPLSNSITDILNGLVAMISACQNIKNVKRGRPGFDSLLGRYLFFFFAFFLLFFIFFPSLK